MKTITQKMLNILERLAEMFPNQSYQQRFEQYIATRNISTTSELEYFMKEFDHKVARGEVWKN